MRVCSRCKCRIFPGETQCPDCGGKFKKEPSRDQLLADIDNLIKDLQRFRKEVSDETN